jgi:hypothetical protein
MWISTLRQAVAIHLLRHRPEEDPANPKYLLTETSLGYRFREP